MPRSHRECPQEIRPNKCLARRQPPKDRTRERRIQNRAPVFFMEQNMNEFSRHSHSVLIGGLPVADLTVAQWIETIVHWATRRSQPRLISYVNAWSVCVAHDHPDYRRIMTHPDTLLYADGQSIVWASDWLGRPLPERINAGDFWPELCRRLVRDHVSIYLLGGRPGEAETAASVMRRRFPGLNILGVHPGFFSEKESDSIARAIRDSGADMVWIGMGAPRQECWAARNQMIMRVPVVWCVGALFEYIAGHRSRAPIWMRRAGLEWAYRLVLEPGRLWKRYLIGNGRFVYYILKQRLGGARPDQ